MSDRRPSDLVQSVSRAARILDAVASRPEGLTARQIAVRCELNRATAYHLLRTLRYESYLHRARGDRYVLGSKIATKFRNLLAALEQPPQVGQVLRYLTESTGQSAYLGQLVGTELVITDVVEGPYSPHLEQLMVRANEASHATALGKALLASLPAPARRSHLQQREGHRGRLRPFTPHTVVETPRLDEELAKLARHGVFVEQEQYREGVCCAAVAVRTGGGYAAIALPYPVQRWRRYRTPLLRHLRQVAADLAAPAVPLPPTAVRGSRTGPAAATQSSAPEDLAGAP